MAPNDFVHLHLHTEFSLLDGLGRINELVSEASAHGFDALAITDHGSLYGAVAFYQACKAKGIKPIIGVEAYVARRSMFDREGKADAQPHHLVLLAKDWTGYQNLCRIITAAHLDGYYYKPRLDRELLARHSEGLIGMSACLGGEIAKALEIEDWQTARRIATEYKDILGPDHFFLELQDHGLPEQKALNPKLLRLAQETGLHSRPPTTSTTCAASSTRLTTSFSASAPAPTSTRPIGSASSARSSTSRPPPRWSASSGRPPRPSPTPGASPR